MRKPIEIATADDGDALARLTRQLVRGAEERLRIGFDMATIAIAMIDAATIIVEAAEGGEAIAFLEAALRRQRLLEHGPEFRRGAHPHEIN